MRYRSSILLVLLPSGCGGFRGGIESVPYIDEPAPQASRGNGLWSHEITFSDLTIQLSLNNRVRTYQYEVMLFVIPTYLNFWDEFQNRDAKELEITLHITAHTSDVALDPRQLLLTVDTEEFRPTGVWVNKRNLSLDVNPAIGEPNLSENPLIRFKSGRWSEGYS